MKKKNKNRIAIVLFVFFTFGAGLLMVGWTCFLIFGDRLTGLIYMGVGAPMFLTTKHYIHKLIPKPEKKQTRKPSIITASDLWGAIKNFYTMIRDRKFWSIFKESLFG